jgi:hypothetical protein
MYIKPLEADLESGLHPLLARQKLQGGVHLQGYIHVMRDTDQGRQERSHATFADP